MRCSRTAKEIASPSLPKTVAAVAQTVTGRPGQLHRRGHLLAEPRRGIERPVGMAQDSRAIKTRSAWPRRAIWSACSGAVIMPTAPVGIFAFGTLPPLEQWIRSTPSDFNFCASVTESSPVQPPSVQVGRGDAREELIFSGQTRRTASAVSQRNRLRLAREPPYSSARWLLSGERKLCSK
jgi:hypothetical protein